MVVCAGLTTAKNLNVFAQMIITEKNVNVRI